MNQATARITPLDELEELEEYRVDSKAEIVRVLTGLNKSGEMLTAYLDPSDSLLTSVVAVLADRDLVVFDVGPNEYQNKRLLESGTATFVVRHRSVSIKFTCHGIKKARLKGEPVFAAPLPPFMYRLQRREFFRVNAPVARPILCQALAADGSRVDFTVSNVSAGGVGLVYEKAEPEWEAGQILHECHIDFPGAGTLTVDLEIRNVFVELKDRGTPIQRIGCAFLNISPDRAAFVQRYINKLQIEQKAKANALGLK